MILRTTAAVLALVVLMGATRSGSAASPADALLARSDSLRAFGVAKSVADSAASQRAVAPDTTKRDTARIGTRDSLGSATDSARLGQQRGPSDSAVNKTRSLPPRKLTLRQQVMFAGGFMSFIAIMMASMQNFNP